MMSESAENIERIVNSNHMDCTVYTYTSAVIPGILFRYESKRMSNQSFLNVKDWR